jgi:hypothetical protein
MATLTEQCVSVERMLEEYFCDIHPWFSVIIEPSFRKRLSNLHREPCAETAMLLLTVFMVTGSHDQSTNDTHRTRIYQIGIVRAESFPAQRGLCERWELRQAGIHSPLEY